ncbi:threonylcarbamoyl-AMP synthase [Candidatus Legionella polyplacis]|uniref:L-threonylcarbamoyladenylate synthase n=1 Tax=Candidatus Legionella polyplacis TaxID=2005262 RepID=UPI000C1E8490|nr:L-threonylcarbamoyladenylate synthase [Candidatus Legionella polyplacis]ATW01961.1 threonylcarbamoyl-AMP synthase [Candidatus Legionella polyplacis]
MSFITNNIKLAISYIKQGKIVAIPTETVYGLTTNIYNVKSIKKIFFIKKRPFNYPLIIHINKNWNIKQWISFVPQYVYTLTKNFWPGPLTLVMKAKPNIHINPLIISHTNTIALRCSSHPILYSILKKLKIPLVITSANTFGKISPTTAKHTQEYLKNENILILNGNRCSIGIESTVIDATKKNKLNILRLGAINSESIKNILLKTKKINNFYQKKQKKHITIHSNQFNKNYLFNKPLYFFKNIDTIKNFYKKNQMSIYILAFSNIKLVPQTSLFYKFSNKIKQSTFEFYFQLWKAEKSIAKIIAIEMPPNTTQWEAIKDRIKKISVPIESINQYTH